MCLGWWRLQEGRPCTGQQRGLKQRCDVARDHDLLQATATGEHRLQLSQPFRRRDQHLHIAVLQDESHLLRFEQGVERNKNRPRSGRSKTGDHALKPFFKVNGNTLTTLQPQREQAVGKTFHGRLKLTIGQGR